MSMESMGMTMKSSGSSTWMFTPGCVFLNLTSTASMSSSSTVGVFFTETFSLSIRVTDSRFSTIFNSQLESS